MNTAILPSETLPAYSAEHPAFAGHFPGRPIVPGVLLLDAALHQFCASQGLNAAECRIATAKFISAVGPGEPLRLRPVTEAQDGVRLTVHAGTDDRLAATAIVHCLPTTVATP